MKTRIIVDSTADLVPEIKARVSTVPLTVHFGQEEYIDGVTIDNRTFYEKLIESDVLPTTSQATPDAFIKEFEKVRQAEEAAVVITLASKFSGTYQSAMIAAADYLYAIGIVDDQYPGSIRDYADFPSRIHRSIPASSGCAASDTSRCGYLSCTVGDAFLYALPVGRCC